MTKDKMTNEELINLDKLNSFYSKKIPVHLKLLRKNFKGQNIFLNGLLIDKDSETVFVIDEKVLGELRVSIYEIRPNGVFKEERK